METTPMETTLDRRAARGRRFSMQVAVELGLDGERRLVAADAVNLSRGGLSIRGRRVPDVGTRVRCRFATMPGGTEIDADSEVVWAREGVEDGGSFGLRFVDLDPMASGLIDEMLAERLARSVAGLQAPDSAATLELGPSGTSIQATVARRGRRTARFEQRLDLLALGRALLVREDGHSGRQGNISGVSLHLQDGTPMLSVNVDFEHELSFGEFEWSAAELDAVLERSAPDTVPDLQTPSDAPARNVGQVTLTEFEPALPHLTDPARDHRGGAQLPSVAGVENAIDLVEANEARSSAVEETSEPDRQQHHADVHHRTTAGAHGEDAFGPELTVSSSVDASSPGLRPVTAASTPGADAAAAFDAGQPPTPPTLDSEWDDVPDDAPEPPAVVQVGLSPARAPLPGAPEWTRHAAAVVASVARWTERAHATVVPLVEQALSRVRSMGSDFGKRQWSTATATARRVAQGKPRRRTTAGPARPTARRSISPMPRLIALSALGAGVVGLGVYALSPTQMAVTDKLHRPIAVAPPTDAPTLPPTETTPPTAAPQGGAVPAPASVPAASPYAVDVHGSSVVPAATGASSTAPLFGEAALEGRKFTLQMTAPVTSLRGIADEGGFTVHIPGSLSLDRAGPIAASFPAVRRSMILNRGDHAELTIRFEKGKQPAYRVVGKGKTLELTFGK